MSSPEQDRAYEEADGAIRRLLDAYAPEEAQDTDRLEDLTGETIARVIEATLEAEKL